MTKIEWETKREERWSRQKNREKGGGNESKNTNI